MQIQQFTVLVTYYLHTFVEIVHSIDIGIIGLCSIGDVHKTERNKFTVTQHTSGFQQYTMFMRTTHRKDGTICTNYTLSISSRMKEY